VTGTIYGLVDPRTNAIRYVGFTTRAVLHRVRGHVNEARCFSNRKRPGANAERNRWILEVLAAGLRPVFVELLRGVDSFEASRWEFETMRIVERHGADLVNTRRGTAVYHNRVDSNNPVDINSAGD
jgi:hypothetical protein